MEARKGLSQDKNWINDYIQKMLKMLDKQVIMLYILLLNNVKKNLQIIEEGLHFQASKKGITIVSLVRSTFNALQNVGN